MDQQARVNAAGTLGRVRLARSRGAPAPSNAQQYASAQQNAARLAGLAASRAAATTSSPRLRARAAPSAPTAEGGDAPSSDDEQRI
jgi:hypothetical protein